MIRELQTPLVVEDFEIGDRVYCVFDGKKTKGTVIPHRPGTFACVTVAMDSGWETVVNLTSFDKTISSFGYWGRIPRIEQLTEGNIITRFEPFHGDVERIFAVLNFVVPGKRVAGHFLPDLKETLDYNATLGGSLEDMLMDWEIDA